MDDKSTAEMSLWKSTVIAPDDALSSFSDAMANCPQFLLRMLNAMLALDARQRERGGLTDEPWGEREDSMTEGKDGIQTATPLLIHSAIIG